MNKYHSTDIVSAIEFGQRNPEANMDDWLKQRSVALSEKEKKQYKDISYDKFNMRLEGKDYEFLLIRSSVNDAGSLLTHFVDKLVGVRRYYQFEPMPGEWYVPTHIILSFDSDFFHLNKWDDFKKGIKSIQNTEKGIQFITPVDTDDWDEMDFEWWRYTEHDMEMSQTIS